MGSFVSSSLAEDAKSYQHVLILVLQKMWDNDKEPDTEDMDWHELTEEQRKAAEVLGYNQKTWDAS